jgi:hypothetical protein
MEEKVILTRRKAITSILFLMAGATVGCAPVRMAFDLKKGNDPGDLNVVSKTLGAFVDTVIPGIEDMNLRMVEIFHDRFYRIHKYTYALARDLNKRSQKSFSSAFYLLSLRERTSVIEDGLAANAIATRLYTSAVFFAQIAIYSGLTNSDHGCKLIEFKGTYDNVPTYSNFNEFLGTPVTIAGNPA